jgi:serine/threonine protein kinase
MFKISIILQLIIACSQLHELKIVHNDLTTGNILIDDSNIIKICDFDNLTFFKQDYCSLIGTPKYKSP